MKFQGWVNPFNLSFGPVITSLSSFQSPAGSSTVVSIYGSNFLSYSLIRFGTFTPTVYFINSTILQFYVPSSLNYGTFPVQVCNGDVCSNIVIYTIDAASGFWLLQGQNIINSNGNNGGGVGVNWLSRGIPVRIDNTTPPSITFNNPYKVPNNVNWIITGNDDGSNIFYILMPDNQNFVGREIIIKATSSQDVLSKSDNIIPLNDSNPQNIIVKGSVNNNFYWSTLVFNGSFWVIMQANWTTI